VRLLPLVFAFTAAVAVAQPTRVTRLLDGNPRDTSFSGDGVVLGGALYFSAYNDAVG
jgi:hypothetical protein